MSRIEILNNVPSAAEGFPRVLRVFLPTQYETQPTESFGLIVMHDGQNVFEHPQSARHPTWAANHALQRLLDDGRVGPWLIVAVDHGQGRFEDFSPWPEPRAGVTEARADSYLRFVVEELLPWARTTFRLREGPQWTATAGSSLGGLISLYLHWRRPDVFGRVAALSPSVMWSEEGLFRHWRAHTGKWSRLYLDAGDREVLDRPGFEMHYGQRVHDFHRHLVGLGYAPHELTCLLEPGGLHSEADWQRRLPDALAWALG